MQNPRQIVLMQCDGKRDCAVAAIGTACNVSYDQAAKALNHIDLPGPLESPILSNPWNLYRALVRLGFWKKNITLKMLLTGEAKAYDTIVLVKESLLAQHWVVYAGTQINVKTGKLRYRFLWGDSDDIRIKSEEETILLFLTAWPNCAFQVYRANVFKIWVEKMQLFAEDLIDKLKSWFCGL